MRGFSAHAAEVNDALERYNSRLLEIARSYNQQLAAIRQGRARAGRGPESFRAAEEQVKQLAMTRNKALAEARLIYEQARKQAKAAPVKEVTPELRERQERASQQKAAEEGQNAFWTRVAREQPQTDTLWAAQVRAVEDEQNAFWTETALSEELDSQLWQAKVGTHEAEQNAFWSRLFPAPNNIQPGVVLKRPKDQVVLPQFGLQVAAAN